MKRTDRDIVRRRPMPVLARLPRRLRASSRARAAEVVLACPRLSPEWELGAVQALLKPQTGGSIQHRPAMQRWTSASARIIRQAYALANDRLGGLPEMHFPARGGDHRCIACFPPGELTQGLVRAVAWLLSMRVRGVWFIAGRVFARDGHFYRRQRGYKLRLVPAGDVHVPRAMRAALRWPQRRTGREPGESKT